MLVSQDIRPPIPSSCSEPLRALLSRGWHASPAQRPSFAEIMRIVQKLLGSGVKQFILAPAGLPVRLGVQPGLAAGGTSSRCVCVCVCR